MGKKVWGKRYGKKNTKTKVREQKYGKKITRKKSTGTKVREKSRKYKMVIHHCFVFSETET
jgi:triphosphoribosyl-dephospho-CoA synthetase